MSDVGMCQYSECPKAQECYRFKATPNPEYQAYFEFQNICFEENEYKYFWKYNN